MRSKFTPAFVLLAILGVPGLFAAKVDQPGDALVAHEWGTFTSVAGETGYPVSWLPLSGPPDLPCFVHRLGGRNLKFASGTVRMETPVLYFYAPRPMTLAVQVSFPQGLITEWYPRATRVLPNLTSPELAVQFGNSNGRIEWDSIELRPGDRPGLPVEKAASHYYAARETDAASLRVGGEREKLIFYRGMGDFSIPVQSRITAEGQLAIRNTGGEPIALAILFENRGGKSGYRSARALKDSLTFDMPELTGNPDRLRQEIEEALAGQGLYPKEARAMIETWRDSWFEEGTRLFYIVPRATVDAVLPLAIAPAPKEIARVFVGRIEILSQWMEKNIESALAAGDVPALEKYGRFLQPFMTQIARKQGEHLQSPAAKMFLQSAYNKIQKEFNSPACVQQ